MDKKAILISILKKLVPYRDLAEGILALIEESDISSEMIDGILNLINKEINKNKKVKNMSLFQESLNLVKKIQEQENLSNTDNLDEILNKI
ncbi:hypothetical protein K9M48_00360 [Candidatus Gracilibacteria bacterium]|nr:hypothetical protein [Candidatus Gracilibacteria bacterium]